ncbi:MAG: hypothetical protein AVDCRST_MAG77-578, partial [uncultured Chloroflexi bacterium]
WSRSYRSRRSVSLAPPATAPSYTRSSAVLCWPRPVRCPRTGRGTSVSRCYPARRSWCRRSFAAASCACASTARSRSRCDVVGSRCAAARPMPRTSSSASTH